MWLFCLKRAIRSVHACVACVGQCWTAAVQEAFRGLALAVPHLARELGRWRWAPVTVLLSLMWRVVVLVSLLCRWATVAVLLSPLWRVVVVLSALGRSWYVKLSS